MFETETFVERIPTWALSAMVNGDYSGLNESEIELIEHWQNETELCVSGPETDSDEYFTTSPAFGPATTVIDCICVRRY